LAAFAAARRSEKDAVFTAVVGVLWNDTFAIPNPGISLANYTFSTTPVMPLHDDPDFNGDQCHGIVLAILFLSAV
jgi:hypothetical protein